MPVTLKRVQELLDYNPVTGVFVWKVTRPGKVKAGSVAGRINTSGHRQIGIDGRKYLAHILAWFLMTGVWPQHEVDHRDTVPDNNVWSNLREATRSQQMQNRRRQSNSITGYKGVSPYSRGGFVARVQINGKRKTIGYYKTAEAAFKARCGWIGTAHGEFANSGV